MSTKREKLIEQKNLREAEKLDYDLVIETHEFALEDLAQTPENSNFRSQLESLIDSNKRERLKVESWLGAINRQIEALPEEL